jgi:hypothetical protein
VKRRLFFRISDQSIDHRTHTPTIVDAKNKDLQGM